MSNMLGYIALGLALLLFIAAAADEVRGLLLKRRMRAELQRDELLAALVSCRRELGYCAQQLQTSGWKVGSTINDAIASADAAIAKVKGGAA